MNKSKVSKKIEMSARDIKSEKGKPSKYEKSKKDISEDILMGKKGKKVKK